MPVAERGFFARTLGLVAFGATWLVAGSASAYCRTTTCDPRQETCRHDSTGCIIDGAPLAWAQACISFATQKDGSSLRHIPYQTADTIFRSVFATWMGARCAGGGTPSFRMIDMADYYGEMVCDQAEFNESAPNANIWMFRDDSWPYADQDATLALTTVQYEKSTGVILDADVEVNSFSNHLTTSNRKVAADLQSIATHEAGHFLGLSHTNVQDATMWARYESGQRDIRSLHADDIAGICAIYPPNRDMSVCNPTPAHGFSLYCGGGEGDPVRRGCAVTASAAPAERAEWAGWAVLLALGVGVVRRGRRSIAG